ncbi:MAG: chromosome segregation protein SMC [bacterium]|nr:chromosome segregation protein SMC [bacterium]
MRIKSLQVHGFKSFVDKVVFTFDDGVTAVVGPNGCGKSNVVDAVRWVMGEQSPKRLRGKGMDDVIFAGSETRPPIGMAEVILTFDCSDGDAPAGYSEYSEIEITRRLYRSGESEYLLNKAACRMRDIHDFFRDSGIGQRGYTIVEQGRIAEIVSAKADERRVLIEEAAGISKYRARRREAESKINSTLTNLNRVNDVLGEIKRQISSLERQARKAARFKRLRETQRVLDLSIASDERREMKCVVEEALSNLSTLRDQVTALETNLSQRELRAEEQRIALTETEKSVSQRAEALYALRSEIKQIEGQLELNRRESEGLDESNRGRGEEIAQMQEQLVGARGEAEEAQSELLQLEDSLANESETIRAAEEEARVAQEAARELDREREAANEAFVGILTALARAEDRGSAVEDRRAEVDQRMRTADRELELHQTEASRVGEEETNLEEGLRNLLTDRDRLQEQLLGAISAHEGAGEALKRARLDYDRLREHYEARKARLESLQEVLERREDVGEATRHLIEGGEELRQRYGLCGLVREFLEVDFDAERAVEAVLAERAEAIVVKNAGGAVGALERLRDAGAGRGVFVVEPKNEVPSRGIVPLGEQLLKFVRPKEEHAPLVRNLLGDVYLVNNLAEALGVYGDGLIPATFVTREGDVLSPDGVIRGGGESAGSGMLGRVREVRELTDEVVEVAAQVEAAERAHQAAEASVQRCGEELDNLRNRHHTAALALANHEKDLDRTRERVKILGEAQEGRVAERSGLLSESESLGGEQDQLVVQVDELRTERAAKQRSLDNLGLRISSASREVSRFDTRVTELRVSHNGRVETRNRLQETVGRANQSVQETGEWIERRQREIGLAEERKVLLADQTRAAEESLAAKLADEEEARIASEAERALYEERSAQVRTVEDEVRGLRRELETARESAAGADLVARENQMRLEHQDEAIREKWNVDLASWTPPSVDIEEIPVAIGQANPSASEQDQDGGAEGGDGSDGAEEVPAVQALRDVRRNAELAQLPLEERRSHLEKLRSQLQSLGDVNLGAIEEHEELAERFRFLSEQKEDLDRTIETLREAIARINRTSRRRFRETFEAVSKRFSENFPRLFGGGRASLMLTECEDILDAGVEIMAMPPGKRNQNVNLLSGGEKTMTALALLMAVFQVRPSPFFLLDEVDAALDDANVGRFNSLITDLAAHSQFLVITHNKRTIEVADVLYGVTMEQKGVSKLVSVALT